MPSKLKLLMSSEYKQRFANVNSMLFFDYQGVEANEFLGLRRELDSEGVKVFVIKNRIFKKAMEELGFTGFEKIMQGPLAVAYGEDEGAVIKAAKVLIKFSKAHDGAVKIKGGLMDKNFDDAKTAKKYKDLLTREETLSVIAGQILAVGSKLAAQITSPAALLASQIKKKSEEANN